MNISVIIAAAGRSTRMGGAAGSKVLYELAGRPVLAYALELFSAQPEVGELIVTAAPADVERLAQLCAPYPKARVVAGGADRTASVAAALAVCSPQATHIAVHDGARPLLHADDLRALLAVMEREQAAILAAPAVDTIQRVRAGYVTETLPRAELAAAQTPQMFSAPLLRQAYASGRSATDDATLVAELGVPVKVVLAQHENFKLTYPADLRRAEAVLRGERAMLDDLRSGCGLDSHVLTAGRKLILGGVEIPYELGLAGHSDADVLLHAIIDALLGAAALPDIGRQFPDTDPQYKDASSRLLLRRAAELVRQEGWQVANVDSTLVANEPKMAPYIDEMRGNIAADLGINIGQVAVKAKTAEGLNALSAVICSQAVVLLRRAV